MLLVDDIVTGQAREVHFRDMTGNRPGSQALVQQCDFENVKGVSSSRFLVRLDVHCNPYEVGECTNGRWEVVLRYYGVTVDLPSLRISYTSVSNITISPLPDG